MQKATAKYKEGCLSLKGYISLVWSGIVRTSGVSLLKLDAAAVLAEERVLRAVQKSSSVIEASSKGGCLSLASSEVFDTDGQSYLMSCTNVAL